MNVSRSSGPKFQQFVPLPPHVTSTSLPAPVRRKTRRTQSDSRASAQILLLCLFAIKRLQGSEARESLGPQGWASAFADLTICSSAFRKAEAYLRRASRLRIRLEKT